MVLQVTVRMFKCASKSQKVRLSVLKKIPLATWFKISKISSSGSSFLTTKFKPLAQTHRFLLLISLFFTARKEDPDHLCTSTCSSGGRPQPQSPALWSDWPKEHTNLHPKNIQIFMFPPKSHLKVAFKWLFEFMDFCAPDFSLLCSCTQHVINLTVMSLICCPPMVVILKTKPMRTRWGSIRNQIDN